MNRRAFALSPLALAMASGAPLVVRVHHIIDARARHRTDLFQQFTSRIWPEAVRDFARCGIELQTTQGPGEIRRSPSERPIFTGLERGAINMMLTNHVPLSWDNGRAIQGVASIYEGYHLCMIALSYAHGHEIPFLSVNTCVHELLHVLMQDVFERRPKGFRGQSRELRIDWYATRLWLFHDGSAIRDAAKAYLHSLIRSTEM